MRILKQLIDSNALLGSILISAIGITFATNKATAQEKPINVYMKFSGGAIARNMADAMIAFSEGDDLIPVKTVVPKQTTGLCGILETEIGLAPEFCTKDILTAVSAMNRKNGLNIDPDAIRPDEGVVLPAVEYSVSEFSQTYDLDQELDRKRLEQLDNNPSWQNLTTDRKSDILSSYVKDKTRVPQIEQRFYKRIEWQFTLPEDANFYEAQYILRNLSSRNLAIDIERRMQVDDVYHSPTSYSAIDHYEKWCEFHEPADTAEGDFEALMGSLYDTADAVNCTAELQPEVAILDQRIEPHPDLASAFGNANGLDNVSSVLGNSQSCTIGTFDQERDHGLLLSTILASSENNYGFRGVMPKVSVNAKVWDRSSMENRELTDIIEELSRQGNPPVFLFASEFRPYEPPPPDTEPTNSFRFKTARQIWRRANGKWADELADASVRLNGMNNPGRVVKEGKALMIVSAGQDAEGFEGRPIDWRTPVSPQNLGDLDQVLSVAACKNCAEEVASLWNESNRSTNGRQYVGIMAPGGEKIPTYTTDGTISLTTGGTSAAAAFVAGLAARMVSCYPDSYAIQPANLKQRLILASRPIADREALGHVTGGVADPEVSMLDPHLDWLKMKSRKVRPVEFVHWCKDNDTIFDSEGSSVPIYLPRTRRLTDVNHIGFVQQSVERVYDDHGQFSKMEFSRTILESPEISDKPIALVKEKVSGEECSIKSTRLEDLFLSRDYYHERGSCEAVPPCE